MTATMTKITVTVARTMMITIAMTVRITYNGDENGNGKDFWMEASVPQLIHYSLPAVTCPIVSMF